MERPTDANVCHFFDQALVQSKWEPSGNAQGRDLFVLASENRRTFGRVSAKDLTLEPQQDRLQVNYGLALSTVSVDLDFRIVTMPVAQELEILGILSTVDNATYHVMTLTIAGLRAELAEFGQPGASYDRLQSGTDLTPGWHHAHFVVNYALKRATLAIDGGPLAERTLQYLPTASAKSAGLLLGFNHAAEVKGPFTVDIDSVIVRTTPP